MTTQQISRRYTFEEAEAELGRTAQHTNQGIHRCGMRSTNDTLWCSGMPLLLPWLRHACNEMRRDVGVLCVCMCVRDVQGNERAATPGKSSATKKSKSSSAVKESKPLGLDPILAQKDAGYSTMEFYHWIKAAGRMGRAAWGCAVETGVGV